MPKKSDIDLIKLLEMKDKGLSISAIAKAYGVSSRTIKRKMKQHDPVTQFAAQLQGLLTTAPAGYCYDELSRMIREVRAYRSTNDEEKKARIVQAINSEAHDIDEVSEDARLPKIEVRDLLVEMINDGIVERRSGRYGANYYYLVNNSGR